MSPDMIAVLGVGFAALSVVVTLMLTTTHRLGQRIDNAESRTSQRFDSLESRVEHRMNDFETRMEQRMNDLEIRIEQRLNEQENRMDQRLNEMERRQEQRFDKLESHLDNHDAELAAVRERLAHLDGLLDGLREAIYQNARP